MAIYHLHLQIITRGEGKSAVAAAAYRSGETLTSEYDGVTHDYTHKGGIVHTEILLPANTPAGYADRNALWNAVEKIEKQKNAQLAREVELALPVELSSEQNISLLRRYVRANFVDAGMCADIAVHDKDDGNPHAHIMLTMRPFNANKTWGAKIKKVGKKPVYTTDWNDREKAEVWRAAWAGAVNEELAAQGFAETVDHRSYERQGVDKIPSVHLGVSATQMERRGIVTDRGNINREIVVTNSGLRQTRARIDRVALWVSEIKSKTPPSLYDTLMAELDNPERSKPANLKSAFKTHYFLTENHIRTLPELADKVEAMRSDFNGLRDNIKATDKRLKTLDTHVQNCKNFTENRSVRRMYDRLKSEADAAEKATGLFAKSKAEKARKTAQDFYRDHTPEIETFKAAEKYLRDTLQGRFDPKKITAYRKKWESEIAAKKADRHNLNIDYRKLTDELKEAETLKRFAIKLMLPDETPQDRQRVRQKTHLREE
jgi:uncharacterized protein YpuA (DUF1002 family)